MNRSLTNKKKSQQQGRGNQVRNLNSFSTIRKNPSIAGSYEIFGFPDEYVCKLRYSMQRQVTAASGTIVHQAFRANSCYDPDFTSTGHQPSYFDTLATVYGRYFVEAAQLDVQIVNTSTTVPMRVIVNSNDQGQTYGSMDFYKEMPYSEETLMSIGSPARKLSTPILSTSKIMGIREAQYWDDAAAAVTANPADPWWIEVHCQAIDQSSTFFGYIICTLTQYVRFKDLIGAIPS